MSKLHAGLRLRSHFTAIILLPGIEISHDCIIVEIALNSDRSIWSSRKYTISLFFLHFESEKVEWPSYLTSPTTCATSFVWPVSGTICITSAKDIICLCFGLVVHNI